MSKFLCLAALMMVLVVPPSLAEHNGEHDPNVPECINELEACGPFVNSTTATPPPECCQPLGTVLQNELSCICGVFSSVEVIQTLSLNVTEALTLPQRCNITFDLTAACEALPPAMAPSTALNEVSSAVMLRNNIASTGTVVLGSFLIWATLMFY